MTEHTLTFARFEPIGSIMRGFLSGVVIALRPIDRRLNRSGLAAQPRRLQLAVLLSALAGVTVASAVYRSIPAARLWHTPSPAQLVAGILLLGVSVAIWNVPDGRGGTVSIRPLDLVILTVAIVNGPMVACVLLVLLTALDGALAGPRLWYFAANFAQRLCAYGAAWSLAWILIGTADAKPYLTVTVALAVVALTRTAVGAVIPICTVAFYYGRPVATTARSMLTSAAVTWSVTVALLPLTVLGYATDASRLIPLSMLLLALRTLTAHVQRSDRNARIDCLTGLDNRNSLDLALDRHLKEESLAGVLIIDLNDLKPVNDTHGHAAGDALLVEAAARLRAAAAADDTVCRLGGDEFAVIVAGDPASPRLVGLRSQIRAALAEPYSILGMQLDASASVGAATFRSGMDRRELLATADRAMYEEKAERPSRSTVSVN